MITQIEIKTGNYISKLDIIINDASKFQQLDGDITDKRESSLHLFMM